MSQELAKNTLQGGLVTDRAPADTNSATLTSVGNSHVRPPGGGQASPLRQAEPGNSYEASLPENYVVMGGVTFGAIHYLALAEVIDGVATGLGQLGSFPAPAYDRVNGVLQATGALRNEYRPLQNYYPLGATEPQALQADFGFDLAYPVEMRAQASFDNTVNLLFTDGRQPGRLVNTRFRVEPARHYRIIERDGTRDTNLYYEASFAESIRHFQRSPSQVQVSFEGLLAGGKLQGGTWQYFFRYVSQDNTESDVVAWSPRIPVFDTDNTYLGTAGTTGTTTRRVSLALTGLDTRSQYLRVYAVRHFGENGSDGREVVRLTPDRTLTGPSITISHTGFETTLPSELALLSLRTGLVDTYHCLAEAKRHLFVANTTDRTYSIETARRFAWSLQLGFRSYLMSLPGVENSTSIGSAKAAFLQNQRVLSNACWAGGYANPRNCADYLGYAGGEALPYGVVLQLLDGTDSDVFPMSGHDMLLGEQAYDNSLGDADYDDQGWATVLTGQNRSGVLRFPHRNAPGMVPLLPASGDRVNILGVTLTFPTIPQAVLDMATGCYFVRGSRVTDRLATGYLIPTVTSLLVGPNNQRFDHFDSAFQNIWDNQATGGGRNQKAIPAPGGFLEAAVFADIGWSGDGSNHPGAFGVQMSNYLDQANRSPINRFRYALVSPDVSNEPLVYSGKLHGRAMRVQPLAWSLTKLAEKYDNYPSMSATLYKSVAHELYGAGPVAGAAAATSYWTLGGDAGINDGQFGGRELYLRSKVRNSQYNAVKGNLPEAVYLLNQTIFDDYVGIRCKAPLDPGKRMGFNQYIQNTAGNPIDGNVSAYFNAAPTAMALLVNLYPDVGDDAIALQTGGARPREVLRDIYAPASISYFPITQRLSWAQLEDQLDSQRRLTVFGGDTYVGGSYRRISRVPEPGDCLDANYATAELAQVVHVVCESDSHPCLRFAEPSSRAGEILARTTPALVAAATELNTLRTRNYRMPESQRYNHGYATIGEGDVSLLALAGNVPYRESVWPCRVGVTARNVAGAYDNGYRRLLPAEWTDYDARYGPIIELGSFRDQLLLAQERGLTMLAISERTLSGGDSQGSVFVETRSILPIEGVLVSDETGIQHPGALLSTDNGVYGLDVRNNRFWFWNGGAGVKILSEFVVEELLQQFHPFYADVPVNLLTAFVRLAWDPGRGDVLLVLNTTGTTSVLSPRYETGDCLLLVYNEAEQQFVSTMTYRAQHLFGIGKLLYTVPLWEPGRPSRHGVFAHDGLGLPGYWYEQPHGSWLEVVVVGADQATYEKLYKHLMLINTVGYPTSITVSAQAGGTTTQPLSPLGPIEKRTLSYEGNQLHVTLPRDGQLASSAIGNNQLRGTWCRFRLDWRSGTPWTLRELQTLVQSSFTGGLRA